MSLPVGIDALKSTIGRRGGVARNNRFAVYITHPSGKQGLINTDITGIISNVAGSLMSGGKVDPFTLFNDPRDMFLLCESTQLPGKRIATMESFTTHKSIKKPYSYLVDEVTFTFLLTNDYYIKKYFDSWQDMIVGNNDKKIAYKEEYTTDLTIQQIGGSNDVVPAYSVKLKNVFPIAVNAVELSNTAENTVALCSVTMSFDDWEEQGLVAGFKDLLGKGKSLIDSTLNLF